MDSVVLECVAKDLPSGELSFSFQVDNTKFSKDHYVDLAEGLDTLAVRTTVPTQQQTKNKRFTCQVQKSLNLKWTSNSTTSTLFGEEYLLSLASLSEYWSYL